MNEKIIRGEPINLYETTGAAVRGKGGGVSVNCVTHMNVITVLLSQRIVTVTPQMFH